MNSVRKLKLMPLIIAAVMFILGVILIFISDHVGTHMPVIMGTFVLAIGITRIIYGFLTFREELDARNNITLGVLDVIWGIIMLILHGDDSAFVVLFGIWCMIGAVLELAEMVRNIVAKITWVGLLVDSVINIVFGIVMFVQPWQYTNATKVLDCGGFTGIYLLLNAFTVVLITLFSIKTSVLNKKVVEEVAQPQQAPVEEATPVVEEAPVQEEKVEEKVEEKPAAKKPATRKTTTTKSATTKASATKTTSTTKKAPATKTAAKSTATKSAAKTGTTTAKKTTSTAKKPAAKKEAPKAE